jgi:ATP-dependent Clp protease, protease subunit
MFNKFVPLVIFSIVAGFVASSTFYGCSTHVTTIETTKTVQSSQPPGSPVVAPKTTKDVTRIDLPKDRTVLITGPIEDTTATVAKLMELGKTEEPIYLVLNSPGGSVLDGAAVITALEAAKGPVYTVCNQLCASMAAMIFEHGTQRYAVDRSFIMMHPASGGAQGEVDKMVSRLSAIQRYVGKMEAYIATRAGISFERYKQLSGIEFWIDSEDAVNSGLVDKVVAITLPDAPAQVFLLPQEQTSLPIGKKIWPNAPTITSPSNPFTFNWSL